MRRRFDPGALKTVMRRRGVTQMALAVYLGESLGAVNCKCRGIRDWWLWEVQALIGYLCLSPQEANRVFFSEQQRETPGGGR